jgi:alginate O-acetyltransferase complex protein AlgF
MPIKSSAILWLFWLFVSTQSSIALAQAIAHIYAPRPPAGSAFVRVVNPGALSLRVQIGPGAPQDQLSSETQIATIYRIVPGGQPLTVEVNGKPAKDTVNPPPDKFVTLVVKVVEDRFELKMIVEDTSQFDGLRADLRFYNIVSGCTGGLSVVDGPQVFDAVPTDSSQRRSINPVEANLYAECDKTHSSLWTLPSLRSGDHYSLFLVRGLESLKLVGQLDQTEPYHDPTH